MRSFATISMCKEMLNMKIKPRTLSSVRVKSVFAYIMHH